ncbi:MAG: hypothetical protein UV38_C0002G0261 [candidate division TM6 bacterium GW2011_GWE2_42_60]|nr:MAG: hypothetical protein UV38_C0002G0261 [candidate division TM6 bacterium GW2011_GWE2_42_60]HBY05987.1 hypothetical protein [Candidatus Dependentiae bacterium]
MNKNRLFLACALIAFGVGLSSNVFAMAKTNNENTKKTNNENTNLKDKVAKEQELKKQMQRSKEMWFGFSTGFLFPFIYTCATRKSFSSTSLRLPENASAIARFGAAGFGGVSIINVITSSLCHDVNSKETVWDAIRGNELSMINFAGRNLVGPLACMFVNDHYGSPLVLSLLFSAFGMFKRLQIEVPDHYLTSRVLGGKRASWSRQAGIVSGMLAGRLCNQGIKLVGQLIARNRALVAPAA